MCHPVSGTVHCPGAGIATKGSPQLNGRGQVSVPRSSLIAPTTSGVASASKIRRRRSPPRPPGFVGAHEVESVRDMPKRRPSSAQTSLARRVASSVEKAGLSRTYPCSMNCSRRSDTQSSTLFAPGPAGVARQARAQMPAAAARLRDRSVRFYREPEPLGLLVEVHQQVPGRLPNIVHAHGHTGTGTQASRDRRLGWPFLCDSPGACHVTPADHRRVTVRLSIPSGMFERRNLSSTITVDLSFPEGALTHCANRRVAGRVGQRSRLAVESIATASRRRDPGWAM